jgi:glycosyltransferase involved in cell wall biosynthesis
MNRSSRHGAKQFRETPETGTLTISIGMPVYNGEATIGTAIAAVLAQTFADFELIVSDNASTDGTVEICRRAAMSDPRIRIIEQPRNLGAAANFEFVLKAAQAPFFAFAAADDWMEPNFIEETLGILQASQGAVACAPRTSIHFANGRSREAYGTKAIRGPAWWRVTRFFFRPADNSRFYGLFRTAELKSAYLAGSGFHALDWAISALTLVRGSHSRTASIVLHRQGAESGKYYRHLLVSGPRSLDRWFPVARMSAAVLARLDSLQKAAVLPVLILLNAQKSIECIWESMRAKVSD